MELIISAEMGLFIWAGRILGIIGVNCFGWSSLIFVLCSEASFTMVSIMGPCRRGRFFILTRRTLRICGANFSLKSKHWTSLSKILCATMLTYFFVLIGHVSNVQINKHLKNSLKKKLRPCSGRVCEPLAESPLVPETSSSLGLKDHARRGEVQNQEGMFGTWEYKIEE